MSDCPANTCWTKSAPWRMGLRWALTTSEISGRMILYFKKRIRDGGGWSDWKAFRGAHFSSLSSSSLDRALAAALFPHLRPLYLLVPGATKVGELETAQAWAGGCFLAHAGCATLRGSKEPSQSIRAGAAHLTPQCSGMAAQGSHRLIEGTAEGKDLSGSLLEDNLWGFLLLRSNHQRVF